MQGKFIFRPLLILCLLLVCFTVPGVLAGWEYTDGPAEAVDSDVPVSMNPFHYGLLYITRTSVTGGTYRNAEIVQTGDLDIRTEITLNRDADSSVVVEVTVYNNTNVSYYYNKTETVSWNNDTIGYTVTGIEAKEEVPAYSFKTFQVIFAYAGNDTAASTLAADLHFNFVVDKESIGGIVAQTAVDRFRDILNNVAFENSYQTLEDTMNNRSGWNKASAVTYIGNVFGSSSADSQFVESLFGDEFMSMDLDGDGKAERITMMIKRENLDGNEATGDAYTYTAGWGNTTTVRGAEMTLYITSTDLSNVSNGRSVVVYAAAFTKLPGATVWTDLVPLTKGKADANNYGGYGNANSFNTDTWLLDTEKSMKELAVTAG